MASGLSNSLRYIKRKKIEKLPEGASRDRSLRGKARIKERREQNRLSREANRA